MLGDDDGVRILIEEGQQIVLVDTGFVAEPDDRRTDTAGLRQDRRSYGGRQVHAAVHRERQKPCAARCATAMAQTVLVR